MNTIVRLVLLLLIHTALSPHSIAETITSDPRFESRLIYKNTYKTQKNDTLRSIAYFLYGHKSWWVKLKKQNPNLKSMDPDARMKAGLKIRYKSPEIKSSYVVQPNDWFIRIVQWKYGDKQIWQQIYQKNSARIHNPNLIHPGERLLLEEDGTVLHAASGKVILDGIDRTLSRAFSPYLAWLKHINVFWLGFSLGLLVLSLVFFSFYWKSKKNFYALAAKTQQINTKLNYIHRDDLIYRDGGEMMGQENYHSIHKKASAHLKGK